MAGRVLGPVGGFTGEAAGEFLGFFFALGLGLGLSRCEFGGGGGVNDGLLETE